MPKKLGDIQDKFNMVISDDLLQNLGAEQIEFLLAKILELTADAVVSIDDDSNIILFNQGAEEMFGYEGMEIVGKSLDTLIPEESRGIHSEHVKTFKSSISNEQCAWKHMSPKKTKLKGRRKDGTCFPMEASISKFEYRDKTYYSAIIRDVTQRVEEEDEIATYRKNTKQKLLKEISKVAGLKVDTNSRMLTQA